MPHRLRHHTAFRSFFLRSGESGRAPTADCSKPGAPVLRDPASPALSFSGAAAARLRTSEQDEALRGTQSRQSGLAPRRGRETVPGARRRRALASSIAGAPKASEAPHRLQISVLVLTSLPLKPDNTQARSARLPVRGWPGSATAMRRLTDVTPPIAQLRAVSLKHQRKKKRKNACPEKMTVQSRAGSVSVVRVEEPSSRVPSFCLDRGRARKNRKNNSYQRKDTSAATDSNLRNTQRSWKQLPHQARHSSSKESPLPPYPPSERPLSSSMHSINHKNNRDPIAVSNRIQDWRTLEFAQRTTLEIGPGPSRRFLASGRTLSSRFPASGTHQQTTFW